MKHALYAGLLLGLIPLQTTMLQFVSLGGIRPDLCLVAAVLIGFTRGPVEGLLMGFALGYVQDLFSAGQVGLNLMSKGMVGLMAGAASRYVTNATVITTLIVVFVLSVLSGTVFLLSGRAGEGLMGTFYSVWSVLLPQAIYDAAIAAGMYWLIGWRVRREDSGEIGLSRLVSRW
jgi:rod shape-determining protein MreD